MPRKKNNIVIQKNRIKDAIEISGASQRLVSLWLDVNYTTVSSWKSNTTQPGHDNLDMIGQLVEEDNRMLLVPQGRINSGFAKALEAELKRLHKEEGLQYEIEKFDRKKGKAVKVNNPKLIKKLKDFADIFNKKKLTSSTNDLGMQE